jgi:hypothetical protein
LWQKAIILGALLASVVFLIGWGFQLATMRMLIVRSLVTATGTILVMVMANKAIDRVTATEQSVDAPLNDLNLGEFLKEDESAESVSEPEDTGATASAPDQEDSTEADQAVDEEMSDADLQDELEEQVEQGNEEGVEQIADLISDSMEEDAG